MKTPLLNAFFFQLFQINRPDSLQSREICWHLFRYSSNGNVVLEAEKCCYPDPMFYPPTTGPCTRLVPKSCPPLFPDSFHSEQTVCQGDTNREVCPCLRAAATWQKARGIPRGEPFQKETIPTILGLAEECHFNCSRGAVTVVACKFYLVNYERITRWINEKQIY